MTAIVWFWLLDNVKQLSRTWHYRRLVIKYNPQIWFVLLIVLAPLCIGSPTVYASEICEAFASESDVLNTLPEIEDGGVTVIGHLPNHNYVVVVPGRRDSLLIDVRRYIPDAFMTSSRLGAYVHAGAFENRGDAESLSIRLRACKIRSRVVYFRNGHPV